MTPKELHRKITAALKAKRKGEILRLKTKGERNEVLKLKGILGWDISTEKTADGFRVIAA